MLREIKSGAAQQRRWFQNSEMDLFVWSTVAGKPNRFEFTYDKPRHEKSLVWTAPSHYTHCELDDGARSGQHPGTPIHGRSIPCDVDYVLSVFARNSAAIDPDVIDLVQRKIADYKRTMDVATEPEAKTSRPGSLILSIAIVLLLTAIIYWIRK
jgi:hypothetical protein